MEVQLSKEQRNMDLNSILSSPSYSPLALRHLPQPVPNGLPSELDAKIFTFQDAFEDLIVASKGQELPDIKTRYQQRQLLRSMFPSGEPNWFWLRRLESQGLFRRPGSFASMVLHQPDWRTFHEELDRMAESAWRHASNADGGEAENSSGLFGDIGRAFRALERGFFGERGSEDNSGTVGKTGQCEGSEKFDELFPGTLSDFKERPSSWDTFLKIVTRDDNKDTHGRENHSLQIDKDAEDVVTTRDEHVDRFGYLHQTVTRKTLDMDGQEVGLETYVTIRPADKHINNGNEIQRDRHSALSSSSDIKGSKWFWK